MKENSLESDITSPLEGAETSQNRQEPAPTALIEPPASIPSGVIPPPLPSSIPPPLPCAPLAYENHAFLNSPDGRLIRIVAEYLEPLSRFRRERIQDTVVFFGSARFRGRDEADHALELLENTGSARPAPSEEQPARAGEIASGVASDLQRKRAVAAVEMARYYEDARSLAQLLTRWAMNIPSRKSRFVVTSGGGPGIMEAANRGACDVGAKSIGLNIGLARQQSPNPYVTPELCFQFHYFAIRKLHFLMRARALVAFPGGYGTLDEIFEVLSLAQTRKMSPVPVILVGENYWRRVFDAEFLVDEGVIDPEDRDLFWFAETADQIWRDILSWYESSGRPLLPPSERISQEQGGDS